jgi:hypothetical protein
MKRKQLPDQLVAAIGDPLFRINAATKPTQRKPTISINM